MVVQPGLCRTWSETLKSGFLTTRLIYFVEQVKIAERVQLNEIPLPAAPEEAGTTVCLFILSYCGYTSSIYAGGYIVLSFHFCFMGITAAI